MRSIDYLLIFCDLINRGQGSLLCLEGSLKRIPNVRVGHRAGFFTLGKETDNMALKRLDDKHRKAIEMLLEGKKSNREIADEICVHYNSITNWQKDPLFQRELKEAVVHRTHSRLNELVDAMMDTAISQGNAAMAKLILQMNEMLTDKVSVQTKDVTNEVDYDALDEEIDAFSTQIDTDN
jgi:Helix-turn-helix of insertion element transposase